MNQPRVFDLSHYRDLNTLRESPVRDLLCELGPTLGLQTAVDVGCGLGYFSGLLRSLGFQVIALDGREENVEEAQRRFLDIAFRVMNVEDPAIRELGRFDLVLCFGLLYHLENPFQAIRHLHAMTAKLLLVEGIWVPSLEPILALRDEGPTEDQGLNHVAFYPSEACLVKLFYRAGFRFVYRFAQMPNHPLFRATRSSRQVRTMLAASQLAVDSSLLTLAPEPTAPLNPWATSWAKAWEQVHRLRCFASKPWPEKLATLRRRVGWG